MACVSPPWRVSLCDLLVLRLSGCRDTLISSDAAAAAASTAGEGLLNAARQRYRGLSIYTERERARERHRQTDRQTERQTEGGRQV